MNTNELLSTTAEPVAGSGDEPVVDPTGQLRLLPPDPGLRESTVHARFRLSKTTRERGMRHVAEIRAQLAASKAAREAGHAGERSGNIVSLPPRRQPAA
ncbi:MAG: hypothetical protein AAFP84_14800 [Actinomycetota bacterium]